MVEAGEAKSEQTKAAESFYEPARAARQAPGFGYVRRTTPLTRIGESVTNELDLAKKEGDSPGLLVVDDFAPARWVAVHEALLENAYAAVGAAAEPPEDAPEPPVTPTLASALGTLDDERRRLNVAMAGKGADKEREKALRQAIYGGRTVHRSRPAYEAEFETILSSIRKLKSPPTAVKKMVPRIEAALRTLKGLPPTSPGRPAKEPEVVPAPVQHAALALNFALDALLAQAAADATDARLASLQRVIVGRRKGDAGGGGEKDEANPSLPDPVETDRTSS